MRDSRSFEGSGRKAQRETLIENALAKRTISKPQAKALAGKKLEFVQSYLAMQKAPLLASSEDDLAQPDDNGSAPRSSLSAEVIASINEAVKASGFTGDKAAAVRAEMIKNATKELASMNGAGGRY